MPYAGHGPVVGLAASVVLHALLFVLTAGQLPTGKPDPQADRPMVIQLRLLQPAPESARPAPDAEAPAPARPAPPVSNITAPEDVVVAAPKTPRQRASMAAPPAPTVEEWAFAGRYTLKNGKAYRYTWGRQVRSMMGTVDEGPDQGMVRFRVEISPDGSLAGLETLWSTSPAAERLARQAIGNMPRWPATPTRSALIFERTISFTPLASDGPPIYKDDCLPDPPVFSNPFAWDGKSPQVRAEPKPVDKPDPQALADCIEQLPQDSIEAERARDQRLMDQWGQGAARPGN